MTDPTVLAVLKSQRKRVHRAGKEILNLAGKITESLPLLIQDLTAAALYLDKAEDRLLTAETRIEDARKKFAEPGDAA